MKQAIVQRKGSALYPFSKEDEKIIKEYLENQPLKLKISGVKHPRSYQQLKLYWACCKKVAENLTDKTEKDVDFAVKVELKHIKAFRIVNGVTMIEVGSISFPELPHLMACGFFDRAFPVMAKMIGVTQNELFSSIEGGDI